MLLCVIGSLAFLPSFEPFRMQIALVLFLHRVSTNALIMLFQLPPKTFHCHLPVSVYSYLCVSDIWWQKEAISLTLQLFIFCLIFIRDNKYVNFFCFPFSVNKIE